MYPVYRHSKVKPPKSMLKGSFCKCKGSKLEIYTILEFFYSNCLNRCVYSCSLRLAVSSLGKIETGNFVSAFVFHVWVAHVACQTLVVISFVLLLLQSQNFAIFEPKLLSEVSFPDNNHRFSDPALSECGVESSYTLNLVAGLELSTLRQISS